jgi:hypothetical protein
MVVSTTGRSTDDVPAVAAHGMGSRDTSHKSMTDIVGAALFGGERGEALVPKKKGRFTS